MSKINIRPFSAEIQLGKQVSGASLSATGANAWQNPAATHGGQAEILAAIAQLRQELFKIPGGDTPAPSPAISEEARAAHNRDLNDARLMRVEIEKLSSAIDTTKIEIASMRFKDLSKTERIADVTHELDAVVLDTEHATNSILGACEEIEKHVEAIGLQASSSEERTEIDALSEKIILIYEACNFQDITGQRITKVVNTLKFIEERIDAMMGIWGGNEAFAAIELPDHSSARAAELLLNGPARSDSVSVSQDDIDALFD
ncbi:MAG TPA: protein phosphatase CheZ [Alphaproteobacteria bacterium]|nr:protein phosphatase CheZ [Alphaproteobacteria bacterium]